MNIIFGLISFALSVGCGYLVASLESFSEPESSWLKELSIMVTQGIFAVIGVCLFVLSLAFLIPES